MNTLLFRCGLISLTVLWLGCKEPMTPAEPTFFLKTMTESRYTPDDSLTITYHYDQTNRLEREERKQPFAPGRIVDLYESKDLSQVYADQCRIHSYNMQNQEISVKRYFFTANVWLTYDADSLIYAANQLAMQVHKDYFFQVDGGQYAFSSPLWLTKRTFTYDSQNRVASETDSVFITHDIPVGSTMLTKAPATYLHTNKTTYTYDDKGMMVKLVAISDDKNKPRRYSNGWYVISTSGGYSSSVRMPFTPGTTTYMYEHNSDGQLSRKTATYTDGKSAQNYVSRFTYEYGMKQ
ncbi:hypothetical protein [Spirosoma validum]|uniref:DUF4595 domain-containing protein n=1 Tax=Spirosoma validum TaxID=2771355 RepID=A0A927B8A3_9BACT|nr:hypothetical protein [Spirosoma validum]MBD2757550.1 hypothetical protein [Spirosoma validum]